MTAPILEVQGLDSRYGEVGLACRGHILGSGRAIL